MPVKFWHTSLRFWFFLSYLITTVPIKSLLERQSIDDWKSMISKLLNWITAPSYSLIVSTEPGLKLNSTTLWGINASADPISCPSKKALTVPVSWQFPKSSLARPEPLKLVSIDPTLALGLVPHPYQFWQFFQGLVQTPSSQSIVQWLTVFVVDGSSRLLTCVFSWQSKISTVKKIL